MLFKPRIVLYGSKSPWLQPENWRIRKNGILTLCRSCWDGRIIFWYRRIRKYAIQKARKSSRKEIGGIARRRTTARRTSDPADWRRNCGKGPFMEGNYFTLTTGQGAFKITNWAVEPKTNLPTLDRRRTPMIISSIPFSLANCTRSSPGLRPRTNVNPFRKEICHLVRLCQLSRFGQFVS